MLRKDMAEKPYIFGDAMDKLLKLCMETDKILKEVVLLQMGIPRAIVIEGVVINFCEYKGRKNG